MIQGSIKIRPRYDEVDQMGYVYHANYVRYCHEARTELFRSYGIPDSVLEDHGILLPVIEMNLRYIQPAFYDQPLTVNAKIHELPKIKMHVDFTIVNEARKTVCESNSTIVFVDKQTRKPMRVPEMVINAFQPVLKQNKPSEVKL
ncbi:MAG: acyl-CoA thioesterase [Bacteroidota bacterium]